MYFTIPISISLFNVEGTQYDASWLFSRHSLVFNNLVTQICCRLTNQLLVLNKVLFQQPVAIVAQVLVLLDGVVRQRILILNLHFF